MSHELMDRNSDNEGLQGIDSLFKTYLDGQLVEIHNKYKEQVKSLMNDLSKHKNLSWREINKLKTQNMKKDKEIGNLNSRFSKTEKELDELRVFGNDTTGLYKKYQDKAKGRVFQLVGGSDSVEYDLFYHSFIRKNYTEACGKLGASKNGNIRVSKSDEAIRMVSNWKPSNYYTSKKISEFSKKQSEGRLKKEKSRAFDIFMNKTEGGTILPF